MTRYRLFVAVFVVAISLVGFAATRPSPVPIDAPDASAKQIQLALMVASQLLQSYADETFQFPGPTDGLVPLASVIPVLALSREISTPTTDAWGRPIMYWSNTALYMLVSYGADGLPDVSYKPDTLPFSALTRDVMTTEPQQDIALVSGEIWQGPFSPRGRSRAVLSAMRSIGIAIESYSIDNNFYPNTDSRLGSANDLKTHLEPIYIRHMPTVDTWGYSFRYWSDGHYYALISTGADGLTEFPYDTWTAAELLALPGGPTSEPRADTIFANGAFARWLAGIDLPACP